MAKAVLLSIRPKWCEKIASGEKTIEVRKTRPKMNTPFKCYIYCTNSKPYVAWADVFRGSWDTEFTQVSGYSRELAEKIWYIANGRVAGEFVCDRINRMTHVGYSGSCEKPVIRAYKPESICDLMPDFDFATSCLNTAELEEYLNGGDGYAWHISDLEIYDMPKELTEFHNWKKCKSCEKSGYESTGCAYDETCMVPAVITRAPQSWCYVEDLNNGNGNL